MASSPTSTRFSASEMLPSVSMASGSLQSSDAIVGSISIAYSMSRSCALASVTCHSTGADAVSALAMVSGVMAISTVPCEAVSSSM